MFQERRSREIRGAPGRFASDRLQPIPQSAASFCVVRPKKRPQTLFSTSFVLCASMQEIKTNKYKVAQQAVNLRVACHTTEMVSQDSMKVVNGFSQIFACSRALCKMRGERLCTRAITGGLA